MDGIELNKETAVQQALKESLSENGLICGLRECAHAAERREALLMIHAENCDEKGYTALIEALCKERQIPLVKFECNKKLGEFAGKCKYDKDGKARKVITCSTVAIKGVCEGSRSIEYLINLAKAS